MKIDLALIVAFLTLLSCSSEKNDATMQEAARVHNEVFELIERLENQLDLLQSQPLPLQDSVKAWKELLKVYTDQLIEVPVNEIHHHSEHHHHESPAELTSEQISLIQQEVKNGVKTLKRRMDKSLNQ